MLALPKRLSVACDALAARTPCRQVLRILRSHIALCGRVTAVGLRTLVVSIASCLAVAMTGCSAYQPPKIEVGPPQISERTSEAIALAFPLQLSNPNAEPFELQQFEYALTVNGEKVYTGRRAAQTTLHLNSNSSLTLPAVIPFDRTGWSADNIPPGVTYRLSGSLLYTTPGELAQTLLDTGMRRPTVGFSSQGELTLSTSEAINADVP